MSEDKTPAGSDSTPPEFESAPTKDNNSSATEEEEKKDESASAVEPESTQEKEEPLVMVDQVPVAAATTTESTDPYTADDISDSTPDNDFGDMVLGANTDQNQASTLHVAEQFGNDKPPQYGIQPEEFHVEEAYLPPVAFAMEPEPEPKQDDIQISLENAVDEPVVELDHHFAPGDHVIRWEMLPIVWPIQVHGIVLEVSKQCVTICDFGLTAELRQDESKDKIEETMNEDNPKPNKRLQEAWEKVKPKDNRQKERITIHLITTHEQMKPWKKVHYGRGLFGMGADGDAAAGGHGHGHGSGDHGGSHHNPKPKKNNPIGNWFRGLGKRGKKGQPAAEEPAKQKQDDLARRSTSTVSLKEGDKSDSSDPDITLTTSTSDPTLNKSGTDLVAPEEKEKPTAPTTTTKEKNKLPESDPPKLVLARTQFLLEQGEKILPPYHPFKSNSECIAVFCKTGYWRTLQASVFLHSTAIGNAKSTFVATVGVAASMPLLAPAMALAGAAMVGAPYIILKQSHQMWNETTLRLNEAFWQQAPNEVFVECIEHWSDLCDNKKNTFSRVNSMTALSEAAEEQETDEKKKTKESEPTKQEMKESSLRYVTV